MTTPRVQGEGGFSFQARDDPHCLGQGHISSTQGSWQELGGGPVHAASIPLALVGAEGGQAGMRVWLDVL